MFHFISSSHLVGPTKASPTPDNELFKDLSLEYSKNHPVMTNDPNCGGFGGQTFKDGITNGAKWYVSQWAKNGRNVFLKFFLHSARTFCVALFEEKK